MERVLIGWPTSHDWDGVREEARQTVTALAGLVHDGCGRKPAVLLPPDASASVSDALNDVADPMLISVGDVWLRDTAPLVIQSDMGRHAVGLRFNGWGGRYPSRDDAALASALAQRWQLPVETLDLVGEGGALETDGQHTVLTTREVMLNANRNPNLDERDVEMALARGIGAEKVLWVDHGLMNDHTDGHIDNLARFVRPGLVVCQAPSGDDPNAEVLDQVALALDNARDAQGRPIEIARIPSPGLVQGDDRRPEPASHMNYIFAGNRIIVPTYDERYGEAAVAALSELFPDHEIIGLSARHVIGEGGAFHCMSNAVPEEARL